MALDPYLVLLRILSDPNLSAKGSPLTWIELDTNLKILVDNIKAIMTAPSTGGFTAYNNGTTYSNGDYVSYNGNIYKYINVTPQSGITPGSDPLTWEITSIGEFAHQQNKDQYLDFGGASQVSAIDIYNFINAGIIPPAGDWYLVGDATTFNSVRIHYNSSSGEIEFQKNLSGTWTNGFTSGF